jgi:hypothetical protein
MATLSNTWLQLGCGLQQLAFQSRRLTYFRLLVSAESAGFGRPASRAVSWALSIPCDQKYLALPNILPKSKRLRPPEGGLSL